VWLTNYRFQEIAIMKMKKLNIKELKKVEQVPYEFQRGANEMLRVRIRK
jgi:hypothetical protein